MNLALRRKRLIAHVLMRDEQDRVPLYETQFKEDWELPGGIVEPLEPARLGAAREVREELGVDLQVGRLLVADRTAVPWLERCHRDDLRWRHGGRKWSYWSLQSTEIKAVALVDLATASEFDSAGRPPAQPGRRARSRRDGLHEEGRIP
jgi:8-oxo-dGTP diphosphatase